MTPRLESPPEAFPAPPANSAVPWWRKAAFAISFIAFFFFVSWDTLKAPFAADEMIAIYWHYHASPWKLLWSQFALWSGYVRPFAGFFYLPTFLVFGLNPVPFHALLLLLLLTGAFLMYRFARALGAGELTSAMVALVACYHGGINNLYYNSVFVFDLLCGIFYFAAFAYYARIRSSGRMLSARQTAAFLGLYICALNSKEMAVTMPAVLFVYELLFYGAPRMRPKNAARWVFTTGRAICWASLVNVVFLYGKVLSSEGLMQPGSEYVPVFSWARAVDFYERYFGSIFCHLPRFSGSATFAIGLTVTVLSWFPYRGSPRRLLRFCWFYILLTPLPIQFIAGRDQACLYVTMAGWAVLFATLLNDLLFNLAGRLWRPEPVAPFLAGAAMLAYAYGSWSYKEGTVTPVIHRLEPRTELVLAEFRALNPAVPRGASVVFLDDPFPETFDMAFIGELWFRDRTVNIKLHRKTPLRPDEIAAANAVFTWRDDKLIRVR